MNLPHDLPALHSAEQTAELLSLAKRTLDNWRCSGKGPDYVKIGRKVFYKDSDIRRFINDQSIQAQTK